MEKGRKKKNYMEKAAAKKGQKKKKEKKSKEKHELKWTPPQEGGKRHDSVRWLPM